MDSRPRRTTRASTARTHPRLIRSPIEPKRLEGNQAHRDVGKFMVGNIGRQLPPRDVPSPMIRNPNGSASRRGIVPEHLGILTRMEHPANKYRPDAVHEVREQPARALPRVPACFEQCHVERSGRIAGVKP